MIRRVFFLTLFILLSACAVNTSQRMAIFDYQDFGPQVIANEVIGNEWWQWQTHGDSRPRAYDVKVVVFKGVSINEAMRQYPVDQDKEQDYRYLEYDQAITYLDDRIRENILEDVTAKLRETQQKIIVKLGE